MSVKNFKEFNISEENSHFDINFMDVEPSRLKQLIQVNPHDYYKDRSESEVLSALRYEGDNGDINSLSRQNKDWSDIFELQSICRRNNFSELEMFYVLSGRYTLTERDID